MALTEEDPLGLQSFWKLTIPLLYDLDELFKIILFTYIILRINFQSFLKIPKVFWLGIHH